LVGDFRTQRKNEITSAIHLYYPDGVLRRTMGFKMRFCLGENIKGGYWEIFFFPMEAIKELIQNKKYGI